MPGLSHQCLRQAWVEQKTPLESTLARMELAPQQLAAALDAVSERVGLADVAFGRSLQGDQHGQGNAEWHLQIAYAQLLTLAESQQLPQLRRDILKDLAGARAEGLLTAESDPLDGEPYLKWASPVRRYVEVLQSIYVSEPSRTVTKDVESILRAATYSLSDRWLFDSPPQDEATVHRRIEGILRCVFPDLLHKPRITKPIKHFEPDTGIPSIHTLIEYKYLSSPEQVGSIADELLADTRGYSSKDWTSFIYAIYETSPIRRENEWRQLLRACELDARTIVVVLTGEAAGKRLGRRTSHRDATAARPRVPKPSR
jgi:hypothetical protein